MQQNLLKSLKTFFIKKEAYTSIKKLPLSIWWKITEGGSFDLLVRKGNYSNIELYNIYIDLLQQYQDNFGNSETHEAFIEAKLNYAFALAKWIKTQESFDKMLLEMASIDLKDVSPKKQSQQKEQKLHELVTEVEEFGFEIDEDKISVYDFFRRRKKMIQNNKAQLEALRNGKNRK